MHYSKYLRGIPEPVVEQPPVQTTIASDLQSLVATGNNVPVTGSINMEFKEMRPEDIVLAPANENHSLSFQVNESIHPTPAIPDNPIVSKIGKILSVSDPIRSAKISKTLDIILNGFESNIEPEMALDEDEAMEVFMELKKFHDIYFADIPMIESPSRMFIWNIPRKVYEDMKKAKEEGLPDYCNPLLPFYLMMSEEPGKTTAYFIKRLGDIRFDESPTIFNKYVQDYLESLSEEDEGDEESEDIESLAQYEDNNE